ncbi:unnamed protein product [Psylliodes chrysocephalus]|uniref:Uncharacterized protein n=1 Tax=Psylliodes chrysocephalus TaxID=3402493 RepID=A0A9P0CU85_9CUCU|nr:unnamed protein product [Psylliodes chrysocephala]
MKLQKTVRLFADRHLENLGNVFETLYKDSLLTDCVLYCKDGAIKAHKVILAASSRYFRQVFIDHADDNAIFMYGISYIQLKNLVELIYKGRIDVPSDSFNSVYNLLEELKVNGVVVDATQDLKSNGIGRDTRFKGQKRVAVDFELKDDPLTSTPKPQQPLPTENRRRSSSSESISIKRETEPEPEKETNTDVLPDNDAPLSSSSIINIDNLNEDDNFIGHEVLDDQEQGEHLSVWAKKERKFKCDLCPSSFKRASHLSRHQLVHTGERPFACDQCDKAFSRHDKLKHHVHKAHEIGALNEALGPDSLYTIDHVDILTPETNMVESSSISFLTQEHSKQNVSTLSSASVSSMDFGEPLQKKARGRPRKYPAVPKPLIKRPRGRPRINPAVARPLKRQRGRPRMTLTGSFGHGHGYQSFQRDSFGEMNYHYKYDNTSNFNSQDMTDNSELENDSSDLHEQGFMEPLVEIKTELAEKLTDQEEEEQQQNDDANFFQRIGLFENNSAAIAKIGECTISMAASCSNNTSSNNTSNNNNTNNTEVVDN